MFYDVHRTCAGTAAVALGTNHVTTKQFCSHRHNGGYSFKMHCVKLQQLVAYDWSTQWVCLEAEKRAI